MRVLSKHFQYWLDNEGIESNNFNSLTGQPYLQNRLARAFYVGANMQYNIYHDKEPVVPETIEKYTGPVYKKEGG